MKLGQTEILMILLVVIIIFGPKQLPKLSKMIGKSIKSFKDGVNDSDENSDKE